MAKIVVVGAGVVGVASAYLLCKQGHSVTLIDRNPGVCEGESVRNGAQLSYAYGDAMSSPTLLKHIPGILLGRDPAFHIKVQLSPEFMVWGLRFLSNATWSRWKGNTRHILEIAQASARLIDELRQECDIAFDFQVAGKMHLYPTAESVEASRPGLDLKKEMGLIQHVLSRKDATEVEPALDRYGDEIGGVVYTPNDAVARPTLFCQGVVPFLQENYGLELRLGCDVDRIVTNGGRAAGVEVVGGERIDADAVVLATAYDLRLSRPFSQNFGGVWPVQGYSLTAPALDGCMNVSITDVKRKMVFAKLSDQVRIAGVADIGPRRFTFRQERFDTMRASAREAFYGCYDLDAGPNHDYELWTGARPMTPSSRPIIRRGDIPGVYLNCGHGMLGWTLSLGSAERLNLLISEDSL